LQPEQVVTPRSHIQERPTRFEVFAVPIVLRVAKQVLEPPLLVAKVGEIQPDEALGPVGGVIHDVQQSSYIRALPSRLSQV
jgi:hypothetical protein